MAFSFLCIVFCLPGGAGAQTGEPAAPDHKSMADVAKQLNNPVADIWALNFQFNRYYLQGEATDKTREQDVMNFQPVLPIHLTKEWSCPAKPESLGTFQGGEIRYCYPVGEDHLGSSPT